MLCVHREPVLLPFAIETVLAEVEFGNLPLMAVRPDGSPLYFPGDLAEPVTQQKLLSERLNFFGPSVAGYRLGTYRRLPEGWVAAPPEIWSDLYMWRKFLRLDGITAATRFTIQSLCLHDSLRRQMTAQQRREETARWMDVIRDPHRRATMVDRYWGGLVQAHLPLIGLAQAREKKLEGLRKKIADLEARPTVQDAASEP